MTCRFFFLFKTVLQFIHDKRWEEEYLQSYWKGKWSRMRIYREQKNNFLHDRNKHPRFQKEASNASYTFNWSKTVNAGGCKTAPHP